jgi:hypothetical protein
MRPRRVRTLVILALLLGSTMIAACEHSEFGPTRQVHLPLVGR